MLRASSTTSRRSRRSDANDDTRSVANTDEAVQPCMCDFPARSVGLGQQRRPRCTWSFSHAEQRKRDDEVRDLDAVQRDEHGAAVSAVPATITQSSPKRRINDPLKKPGENIATKCHSSIS